MGPRTFRVIVSLFVLLVGAGLYVYPLYLRAVTFVREDWWFSVDPKRPIEEVRKEVEEYVGQQINRRVLLDGAWGEVEVVGIKRRTVLVTDQRTGQETTREGDYDCSMRIRCEPFMAVTVGCCLEAMRRKWGTRGKVDVYLP